MEAQKLGLGGSGVTPAPMSSSSRPMSLMPSISEDMTVPTLQLPPLNARRQTRTKSDRPYASPPVVGSLDSQTTHLAKFKKNRRAHSVATSKAETVLTKELPHAIFPANSSIPNLPSHLSVANMRSSIEDIRSQNSLLLKRAISEPNFHSWDFGYTDDVFEAEYDVSPALSERNEWDLFVKEANSRPGTPTPPGEEDLHNGEKKAEDIIFRTTDSGKTVVVAGTLPKLVHYLASEELPDTNYIKMFILTFHRFLAPADLLTQLIENFKNPSTLKDPPTDPQQREHIHRLIKSRIINVLKLWLYVSPDDLHYGDAAGIFTTFVLDLQASTPEEKAMGNSLSTALMSDLRAVISTSFSSTSSPPVSPTAAMAMIKIGILPKPKLPISKVDQFLDVHPKELAKQLTLIDQQMMQSINPRDLTEKSRDKTKASPLVDISHRFNQVTAWVTSEVVSTPHHKQRVLVVTNFVYLIEELLKLRNYHSAMSIYLGLGATPVTRLKDTWKSLSRKISDKWEQLEVFMSPSFNFKKLRAALSQAPRPIIPPLTVLLKDLTFMEENSEFYPPDVRLINFEKISLIGQLLVDIHECSVTNYNLMEVPAIHDYLMKLFVLSEEKIELASKSAMRAATKLAQSNPRNIIADLALESPRQRIATKRRSIMRFFSPEERKTLFSN